MIPFLIFAIVLSQGKGAFLLAGYNTMKESKKEIYNEKALAKFMGKINVWLLFLYTIMGTRWGIQNGMALYC